MQIVLVNGLPRVDKKRFPWIATYFDAQCLFERLAVELLVDANNVAITGSTPACDLLNGSLMQMAIVFTCNRVLKQVADNSAGPSGCDRVQRGLGGSDAVRPEQRDSDC